eukprot:6374415-Pyramimonas_sp.AAC.1
MWAAELHGISHSSLRLLRRSAHASSLVSGPGTCATTAIRLSFGAGRDPVRVHIRRLVAV